MCSAVSLLSRATSLWQQWGEIHGASVAAFSSAVNIHQRLQVLSDAKLFNNITADPDVQQLVLQKQLAAFNHALAIVHQHHTTLQGVVKDVERLQIEAQRSVSSVGSIQAVAALGGPQPSAVECAEALQDMWMMCRDELLNKVAAASLVTLDASPDDLAVLLQCYAAQPNLDQPKINVIVALLRETTEK